MAFLVYSRLNLVHALLKLEDWTFYFCKIKTYFLHLFQITRRLGFSRCKAFAIYIDIHYVYIHSKSNVSIKFKTSYNFERRD